MYFTVGSSTPDDVFSRIGCETFNCANEDMEETVLSITSKVMCPILPIMTAVCILVVTITTLGFYLLGTSVAPL